MISSKPRLVVPYGLKTLLEGVSRAILKTNPTNITQFAAVYFKELIVFREGLYCFRFSICCFAKSFSIGKMSLFDFLHLFVQGTHLWI